MLVSVDADAQALAPTIACDQGRVAVGWEDTRNGQPTVFLNASADAGETWMAADVSLAGDPIGAWTALEPALAIVGRTVHAAWHDSRSGSYNAFYRSSADLGATWGEVVRLNTNTPGAAYAAHLGIAVDAGAVAVVWEDLRDGGADIRLNRSPDHGFTWLDADLRIDTLDEAGASNAFYPTVAWYEGEPLVVWQDGAEAAWMLLAAAPGETPVVVSPGGWPDLVVGERVSVAGLADGDVFLVEFDGTWSEPTWLNSVPGTAARPQLAHGDGVAVVWADHRDDASTEEPREDVYLSRGGEELRLDDGEAGTGRSAFPVVAAAANGFAVAWEEWRTGSPELRAQTVEAP